MTRIATAPVSPTRAAPPSLQAALAWQAAANSFGVPRRSSKVVTENGVITTSHRFLYRGYLQIACCDRKRSAQPIQWSSEYNDTELGLVYYNYRHYNPDDGRWIGRDIAEKIALYSYLKNQAALCYEILGLYSRIGNNDFEYDESKCTLTLVLHISFDFKTKAIFHWRGMDATAGQYPYQGPQWKDHEKTEFKRKFLGVIDGNWNSGYKAKIKKDGAPCPCCDTVCKDGITLAMHATEVGFFTRTEIFVEAVSYADEPVPGHKFDEYRAEAGGD